MQTFLPYEDFEASAVVLDNKRLPHLAQVMLIGNAHGLKIRGL